jgi:hypothetical protein
MRRSTWMVLALGLAAWSGCSSEEGGERRPPGGSGGSGGDGGSGGSGATAGSDATGGATGGTNPTGGTGGMATGGSAGFGDEVCATAPFREQCIYCCDNAHLDARAALATITAECVCQSTQCQSQCATSVCADPPTEPQGEPCTTCFTNSLDANNAQGCATPIVEACQADSVCAAPFTCVDQRGCEAKPPET